MDERRRYPRLAIDVDVCWHKIKGQEADKETNSDTTKNISEGGICLMVYEPLAKGDSIYLKFNLPTGRRINAKGRVMWVDTFEVVSRKNEVSRCDTGIEFIEISDEDRLEVQKFVFSILANKPSVHE